MLTETGSFLYGIEVGGVWHKDFEMRLPTMEDVECALESAQADAGDAPSLARISRYKWASCLVRLGDLDAPAITPELLGRLASTEYGVLSAVEESLLKKLAAVSVQPAPSA